MRRWITTSWVVPLGLLGGLLGTTTTATAQDIELESNETRWRITYEQFDSKRGNDFDLVGIHYDRLSPFDRVPNLYLGLGGYGSVAGDQGGFFLAGATAGYVLPFHSRWMLDGGVFLGAGGGGGQPDSAGWAVRPFLGIERAIGLYGLRAEVAWLDMDHFEIDNVYLAVGVTMSSEVLTARERRKQKTIPTDALRDRPLRITPRWSWLDLDSGTRTKAGRPLDDVQLVGIGVDYFLTRSLYLPFEAYGAVGGGVGGFALAFAGLGVSLPIVERVSFEAKAGAGAGGGGDVDTGGGFAYQGQAGLRFDLTPELSLELLGGYLDFPDGDFEALSATVGLSWSAMPAQLAVTYPRGNLKREGLDGDSARIVGTRVYAVDKIYRPQSEARRPSGGDYDNTLHLAGVRIEQPVWKWFSATGAAYSAYYGDVGGYAEGLLGIKAELEPPDLRGHYFYVIAETGAAGGGGADVRSGWLYAYSAGYRTTLFDGPLIALEAGWFEANRGTFSGEMYTIGIGWDLHRAFRDL